MTESWLIHHELERQSVWREDTTALVFEDDRWSYGEFFERVKRVSNALHREGVGKGDAVVAYAKNHVDLFTIFFACSMTGAIYSPLSTFQSVTNLRYMCDQLDPKICVYTMDDEIADGNLDIIRQEVHAGQFISLDEAASDDDLAMHEFLSEAEAHPEPNGRISPEVPQNIFWTSGTTGRPKGTVRDHRSTLYGIDSYVSVFPYRKADRRLTASDMMFPAPYLQHGITTLMAGGRIVILREFTPAAVCRAVNRWDINTMMLTFTVSNLLLEYLDSNDTEIFIDYIHAVLVSAEQARAVDSLCEELYQFYAISEGGFPLMKRVRHPIDATPSLGRPLPHYDIRLRPVDQPESEIPTRLPSPGDYGEIMIRGTGTMKHLLGDDSSNVEWVRTGDIGTIDDAGEMEFVDRLDNRIRSGGVNIYPNEIEEPLTRHPAVEEAVIVGIDDDRLGERICALLVPREMPQDVSSLVDDLEEFSRESDDITEQLRPREFAFAESADQIPTGAIGKVDRDAIAKRFF